jgi:hypothetical protein
MSVEKFYHRLLLAYPKPYRQEHGDELVGTLLEASSRDTPSPRESLALINAGIAQRLRHHLTGPSSWAECLHLAITFMVLIDLGHWIYLPVDNLTAGVAVLLGLAVLRGWFLLALPLSLLLTAERTSNTLHSSGGPAWWSEIHWSWAATLGLVVLTVNRLRKGRSAVRSRSWLWLVIPLELLAYQVVVYLNLDPELQGVLNNFQFYLKIALVLLALYATWMTRDLRWALAAGLVMIGQSLISLSDAGEATRMPLDFLIVWMTPMLLLGACALVVGHTWRRSRV